MLGIYINKILMYLSEIITKILNIEKIYNREITLLNKKLHIHKMEDDHQPLKLK